MVLRGRGRTGSFGMWLGSSLIAKKHLLLEVLELLEPGLVFVRLLLEFDELPRLLRHQVIARLHLLRINMKSRLQPKHAFQVHVSLL